MGLDNIESQIVDHLKRYTIREWNTPEDTGRKWTRIIKQALVDLGHTLHYNVYSAPKDKLNSDWGEWLYDLCWAVERNDCQELRLKLIAEIQWNTNHKYIRGDFQKLTVGLSKYRVMITEYKDITKFEELVHICKNACSSSNRSRYLMVGIPYDDPNNIVSRSWTS